MSGDWKVNEYSVKSCGRWVYLYTLTDREDKIIDFIALNSADESTARSFFHKSVNSEGVPIQVESYLSALKLNPREQWKSVFPDE